MRRRSSPTERRRRLAAKGFDCVLAYGSNDEQAASARSELEAAHGVRVRTVRGDLTQDESRSATSVSRPG